VLLPATGAWERLEARVRFGPCGQPPWCLQPARVCNLRETNGTAVGCCILPLNARKRRKKTCAGVCKMQERNGTTPGCCILPPSVGKRRVDGRQHTELGGRGTLTLHPLRR
jgi:hypothetical protein